MAGKVAAVAGQHGAVTAGHHESTYLGHLKLGMWIFLASECIVFGSLIGTYLALWGRSVKGPDLHDLLAEALPETILATFILLASGFTMAMAIAAIRRNRVRGLQGWTVLTIVLGVAFLFFKLKDYAAFAAHGLSFNANIGGATFYVLTGTHGVHVLIGLIWLLAVLVQAARRRYGAGNAEAVEVAGLYWHFVDMVWMVVFPVVYLLEFAR